MSERHGDAALEGGWLLRGDDEGGRSFRIAVGETELARAYLGVSIGRHPALCERVLDEDSVSRRHFRIGIADGRLFVEDLNSLNGTQLDGQELTPFQPVPFGPGQEIRAGRVRLILTRLDDH